MRAKANFLLDPRITVIKHTNEAGHERAPTLPSEVSEGSERLHETKSDGNCALKVHLRSRRTRGVPAAVIEVRGLVGSDQLNDA
jgi:hypothetical protein